MILEMITIRKILSWLETTPRTKLYQKWDYEPLKCKIAFAWNSTAVVMLMQVVDLGSGKGYLSSTLALQHGLDVIGIDSQQGNTHGAIQRKTR